MSTAHRSTPESRAQVRLMLQATLFVIVGVFVGTSFSPIVGIAFFVFNLVFAALNFLRALRSRPAVAVSSEPTILIRNDRVLAATLALTAFMTALFFTVTVQRIALDNRIDAVGRCWATDESNSYAVDCDNPAATYRTTNVVDDASQCPVEYLTRDNGEFICIEPIN